ncbi:hypothetical protein ACPV5S_15545 [Vibrio astriarenae]
MGKQILPGGVPLSFRSGNYIFLNAETTLMLNDCSTIITEMDGGTYREHLPKGVYRLSETCEVLSDHTVVAQSFTTGGDGSLPSPPEDEGGNDGSPQNPSEDETEIAMGGA